MTEEEAVAILRARSYRLEQLPGGRGYGVYPDWQYIPAERLIETAKRLIAVDIKHTQTRRS